MSNNPLEEGCGFLSGGGEPPGHGYISPQLSLSAAAFARYRNIFLGKLLLAKSLEKTSCREVPLGKALGLPLGKKPSQKRSLSLSPFFCVYKYIYIYIYMCIWAYDFGQGYGLIGHNI